MISVRMLPQSFWIAFRIEETLWPDVPELLVSVYTFSRHKLSPRPRAGIGLITPYLSWGNKKPRSV